MYLYCYGRSRKAEETGNRLMESCEGEWIRSVENFTLSIGESAVRADGAIILILPLDASVKLLTERIYPVDIRYPVFTIDPSGRFAGILRHMGYNSFEMLSQMCEVLGCKALSVESDRGETAPDLKKAVEAYNMIPDKPELLDSIAEFISAGGNVSIYSDLPITLNEPVLDSISYSMYMFRSNQKKELGQAYPAASQDDKPAVFITCSTLPDIEAGNVLVLTPRRVIVGLELTARTDPDYAVETVERTLVNHGIMPSAVATVAVSTIVRDSDAVKAISERLGCYVTAFDSRLLKAVKLPLAATYSPVKVDADTCTAAACLASDNGNIMVRRAGDKNTVLLTASLRRGTIALTE